MKVIEFVENNKEVIGIAAAGVWELVVRLVPTCKDWSLVNVIKRLFDIIPNKNTTGTTH